MHPPPLCVGKAVTQEVRSILSPLPPRVRVERRSKGKGKSKSYSIDTQKGRKPALKFQKKIVVIDYTGEMVKFPISGQVKEF